jgi:hypothetical protein
VQWLLKGEDSNKGATHCKVHRHLIRCERLLAAP